jgi:hypothetical protein
MNDLLPYVPVILILFIAMRRRTRPRVITPSRLWIIPSIFLALAAWYAWSAYLYGPHLSLRDDLIIASGFVCGVLLGAVRANTVALERHPETGRIQATLTLWGVGFLLLWIIGRSALRRLGYTGASEPFGVFTDTMMVLATASICTRSIVLAWRCRKLGEVTK